MLMVIGAVLIQNDIGELDMDVTFQSAEMMKLRMLRLVIYCLRIFLREFPPHP